MIGFSTACRRFALLFGSALVLVSFWPFSQSFAQLQTPIVRPENAVSFQQQLDVFDWRYRIGYGRQRTGLGYAIGIDFTTSRTEQPKGFLWKDNQVGYFSLSYLLHRKLMLLGRTQVSNFHDEQSAFNFDRQQAAATVAARWRPFDQLSLQPEIGYRWESRRNFDEHGPYVAFSFQADPFEVDGYRNSAAGLAEITRFPERRNANARINYTVFREFHPGTSDSLTVFYDYYRRDNFFSNPMQGNINSLRKEQRGLRNTLRYKVNEHVVFAQNTTITLGNVALQQIESFRNGARHSHNDYSMTNAIELFWQAHTFSGTVDLETAESTIKYNIPDSAGLSPLSRQLGIIGYDETEKRTKIAQRTRFYPNEKNAFQLSFELAKLQKDNSDTTEDNSSDEQRWHISLAYDYKLNPSLSFGVQISAFLKHFVYIDGGLSSNNKWTRLLILQPVVRYRPSAKILFQQRLGVQSQYIDFDFQASGTQTRSYVIRDFYLSDSLALALAPQIDLSLFYRLELEELGSLNWSAFTSRLRTKLHKHWFNMLITQSFKWPLRVGLGASFYLEKRWQFLNRADGGLTAEPIGTQLTFGPIVRLSYRSRNGSVIYFSGQRQRAYPIQGAAYFISHIQLSVQWTF